MYTKLHFVYPGKSKFRKIRSILPGSVITIGEDVVIEEQVEVGSSLQILEDGLYIGKRTYIGYCNQIGKYTSISYDVKIGLVAHPLHFIGTSPVFYAKRRGWVSDSLYDEQKSGFTTIGNDVLISANVTILAGIKIGDGAVIGAGAFVNKDVPSYAIVGGVPARIIGYRFNDHTIEELLRLKWWNLPKQQLLQYKAFYNDPDGFIKKITDLKN